LELVLEAQAAYAISQRGVNIVGSAHATSLNALIKNQTLKSLVGGPEKMILSASERENRKSESKLVNERGDAPPFDIIVELRRFGCWVVHKDVTNAVDTLLGSKRYSAENVEIKRMDIQGRLTEPVERAGWSHCYGREGRITKKRHNFFGFTAKLYYCKRMRAVKL